MRGKVEGAILIVAGLAVVWWAFTGSRQPSQQPTVGRVSPDMTAAHIIMAFMPAHGEGTPALEYAETGTGAILGPYQIELPGGIGLDVTGPDGAAELEEDIAAEFGIVDDDGTRGVWEYLPMIGWRYGGSE